MRNSGFILTVLLLLPFAAHGEDVYHNPVDNKDYYAEHWQKYTAHPQSSSNQPDISNKVHNEGVVLLSPQHDFEEIGAKSLGDYILSLQHILEIQAKPLKDTGTIIIQVELSNDFPKATISYQGDISQHLLQSFYNEIAKTAPLKTASNHLLFQVGFSIH